MNKLNGNLIIAQSNIINQGVKNSSYFNYNEVNMAFV